MPEDRVAGGGTVRMLVRRFVGSVFDEFTDADPEVFAEEFDRCQRDAAGVLAAESLDNVDGHARLFGDRPKRYIPPLRECFRATEVVNPRDNHPVGIIHKGCHYYKFTTNIDTAR